ncbi:hypothetical protein EVAR_66032_1 [Eumeta japonica]|uniref:Uncharacterized protein n=1 Tax=Eumeta variegata TaxID=151549 RepID=A0A4C1Z3U8_EUMVA|nr:hypothetical protein EVAR_66032_1 [Eumeta japonica]
MSITVSLTPRPRNAIPHHLSAQKGDSAQKVASARKAQLERKNNSGEKWKRRNSEVEIKMSHGPASCPARAARAPAGPPPATCPVTSRWRRETPV